MISYALYKILHGTDPIDWVMAFNRDRVHTHIKE